MKLKNTGLVANIVSLLWEFLPNAKSEIEALQKIYMTMEK